MSEAPVGHTRQVSAANSEQDDGVRLLDLDAALTLLGAGTLSIEGRLVDASNATLYCGISLDGVDAACVYKPVQGERPLWDFPDGTLAYREMAAYAVSEATGWTVVPPTVLRDGPYGLGMVQLWIDVDESVDLSTLARSDHPALRRMAVLDAVINNADRKGGHLLPTPEGHVYGVDHGVCFSVEDKLRTLLWGWRGDPLTDEAVEMLSRLRAELEGALGERLSELLARAELRATIRRVDRLLATGVHPLPSGDWPAIPWPPF
ncbi:MAG: SCO1664 family protein [Mycobacteriales bacterium]